MAGDWIKFEVNTFDKPQVVAIADQTELSEQHVVGCLLWVWSWFDQHTTDGISGGPESNAVGVTKTFIDRRVGVAGFAEAMQKVGWLEQTPNGLSMPGFDRHNGESAKKRALTAKRVAKHKGKKANAKVTPDALPREEKRREEKKDSSSTEEDLAREDDQAAMPDETGIAPPAAMPANPDTEFRQLRSAMADAGFTLHDVSQPKPIAMLREWVAQGVTPEDVTDVAAMLREREPGRSFNPAYLRGPMADYLEAKRNGNAQSRRPGATGRRKSAADNAVDFFEHCKAKAAGRVDR